MALRKLSLDERKTNIKVFIELIRDTYPEQCYDVIHKKPRRCNCVKQLQDELSFNLILEFMLLFSVRERKEKDEKTTVHLFIIRNIHLST